MLRSRPIPRAWSAQVILRDISEPLSPGRLSGAILADGTGYYYPPYYRISCLRLSDLSSLCRYLWRRFLLQSLYGSLWRWAWCLRSISRGGGRCMHIILTPGPTPVGRRRMVHTEAGALARLTIPTPGPTLPPDKVRVRMAPGASPSYLRETDRPMPSIVSTANGTVGSIQGSKGGAAAGASTKYGNTAVAKTSSGDMYAAHDGNVYKNTG